MLHIVLGALMLLSGATSYGAVRVESSEVGSVIYELNSLLRKVEDKDPKNISDELYFRYGYQYADLIRKLRQIMLLLDESFEELTKKMSSLEVPAIAIPAPLPVKPPEAPTDAPPELSPAPTKELPLTPDEVIDLEEDINLQKGELDVLASSLKAHKGHMQEIESYIKESERNMNNKSLDEKVRDVAQVAYGYHQREYKILEMQLENLEKQIEAEKQELKEMEELLSRQTR